MGNILRRAKTILQNTDFTALYDKGYHTGSEFKTADDLGIDVMVATKDCKQCTVKDQCTKAKQGKGIQRSQYQQYINQNKKRIENNKEYYRKQQAIVGHPYGTIKRQWGFSYILTKKHTERASAEVGLMFVTYNLRRIFNILDRNELKEYFKREITYCLKIIKVISAKISFSNIYIFINQLGIICFKMSLNSFKFD